MLAFIFAVWVALFVLGIIIEFIREVFGTPGMVKFFSAKLW